MTVSKGGLRRCTISTWHLPTGTSKKAFMGVSPWGFPLMVRAAKGGADLISTKPVCSDGVGSLGGAVTAGRSVTWEGRGFLGLSTAGRSTAGRWTAGRGSSTGVTGAGAVAAVGVVTAGVSGTTGGGGGVTVWGLATTT